MERRGKEGGNTIMMHCQHQPPREGMAVHQCHRRHRVCEEAGEESVQRAGEEVFICQGGFEI